MSQETVSQEDEFDSDDESFQVQGYFLEKNTSSNKNKEKSPVSAFSQKNSFAWQAQYNYLWTANNQSTNAQVRI